MSFKENLRKKIRIDKLADHVISTIGPVESDKKVDKQAMRTLLEMGPYESRRERDLELYIKRNGTDEKKRILVLDNDLPIYETDISDVALRKSPTVKEMVKIRNIIKILNDSDVVKSKKEESVRIIQNECVQELDLHYTETDIDQIKYDGKVSIEMKDAEGVVESLELFGEILNMVSPPKAFRFNDFYMMGNRSKDQNGEIIYGPMVIYDAVDNQLKLIDKKIGSSDKAGVEFIRQVAAGDEKADREQLDVFDYLKDAVLKK